MQRHFVLHRAALAPSNARAARAVATSIPTTSSIRRSTPHPLPLPSSRLSGPLIPLAYAAGRSYDDGDKLLRDWGGGGDEGGGGSDDDEGGGGGGGGGGRGGGGKGKGPNDEGGEGSGRGPSRSLLALAAPAVLLALIARKVWLRSKEEGKGSSGGAFASLTSTSTTTTGVISSSPPAPPPRSSTSPPPPSPPPIPPFSAADDADVQALRRLMREALETLQGHGERLEALEPGQEGEGEGGGAPLAPSSSSAGRRLGRGARLLRDAEAASRFAPLGAMRRRAGGSSARRAGGSAESVSLEGEVVVDGGVASSSSSSPSSSSSSFLPLTRARLRACLHGPARGVKDSWLAQLDAFGGGGGGNSPSTSSSSSLSSAALSKLLYSLSLGRRSRLLLSPLGCRGCDVAPTLNPTAGAGLTSAARDGSSPHSRLGGGGGGGGGEGGSGAAAPSAAAALGWRHRWRGGAGVSAAAFHQPSSSSSSSPSSFSSPSSSSPAAAAPSKTSSLIQLDGPLTDSVSVGVVAVLERAHGGARGGGNGSKRAPSPSDAWERADSPSPSSSSASFGDETDEEEDDLVYNGSSGSSAAAAAATLGAMAAAALGEEGNVTASAWASARVEKPKARSSRGRRSPGPGSSPSPSSSSSSSFPSAARCWGASLASRPDKRRPGWILAVAGEAPPAERRRKGKRSSVTAEASLVLPLDNEGGNGGSVTLVPGVVFARRGGENSVSLACRSVLAF